MSHRKNRAWRVLLVVLVLLVAFRLALPYIITRYVNNQLTNDQFIGSTKGTKVSILDASFELDTLRLINKENGNAPLLQITRTLVTIDWSAILDGKFASHMVLDQPTLNIEPIKKESVSLVSLMSVINDISPIRTNRIQINSGKVIREPSTEPLTVLLHNLQLDALNLIPASNDTLHGRVYLQALSVGDGQLNAAMKINTLPTMPDIEIDARWENVKVEVLNQLFDSTAASDARKGQLSLYSELICIDGKVSGYVKPVIKNFSVSGSADRNRNATFEKVISLLESTYLASKTTGSPSMVVQGEISPEDEYWRSLWMIFSNTFVEYDQTYSASSSSSQQPSKKIMLAQPGNKDEDLKNKRETRKEKRKQRREERRKSRKERRQSKDKD